MWGVKMELKREIYDRLLQWKKEDSGKVLEINGARQVGKTYILTKFSKENYKNFLYINMMQTSGQEFISCLDKATQWEPGEERIGKPIHRALTLFDTHFMDGKDTVVVIDEIQESARVFSLIRQFAREFQAHFIVTGSYLGKTVQKEYFLPAGDVDYMVLETLSYEEFLQAAGKREMYEHLDAFGDGAHIEYDELKQLYDIYCQIGGYPAVVTTYFETGDIEKCSEIMQALLGVFIDESERYFDNVLEMNLFEQIFPAIAQTMVREKKGSKDLMTDVSRIIFKEESNKITKGSVHNAIAWLYRSNIIGYCDRVNEGDILDVTFNCRFYFKDLGVAQMFLKMAGADRRDIAGIINENFVCRYIERLIRKMKVAGKSPMFGLYKGGEIDFLVKSLADECIYGIEVKAGKDIGKTANRMLKDGKVKYLFFLKGNTYGGVAEGRKYTVPIYMAGKLKWVNE